MVDNERKPKMHEWKINDEQRIILNLSEFSFAVVEQDMLEFNTKSLSSFVSRVFENYYEKAEASISKTLSRLEGRLNKALENISPDNLDAVVGILVNQKRDELIKEHTRYSRGRGSVAVRLHNNTLNIIQECMLSEPEYYRNISSYVRAVLEEYSRLPYIDRERIYFKDFFDRIETAVMKKKQLKVTIHDGRQFLVYPQIAQEGDYKQTTSIETDRLNTANYLVGYSKLPGQKKSEKITASFRISSLKEIKVCEEAAFLGETDLDNLRKRIESRGVEFLMNEEMEVRVRLTQNGEFKLSRMLHLRPRRIRQEGDISIFRCTQLQAEFYFIGMGADCEILEPASLRSRFADIFSAGEKIYK